MEGKSNAELLKYYRELRNMDQRTLANKSGLYLSVIIKLELEQSPFTLNTCNKIAEVLNVSPSIFYDDYLNFIINSKDKIKKIREDFKLNKSQFAIMLGTNRTCIREWENGKSIISRINYLKLMKLEIKADI